MLSLSRRFSSASRVADVMRGVTYLPGSLRSLESQARECLSGVYDAATTAEWLEQHVEPLRKMVDALDARHRRLTSRSSWPRRPLPAAEEEAEEAS